MACSTTPIARLAPAVIAGQQDRRLRWGSPVLEGDMVSVARLGPSGPRGAACQDVPVAVRRALQVALSPPTGPVFLSLPMDIQMEPRCLDLSPPHVPDRGIRLPGRAA